MSRVIEVGHPLIQHHLARLRDVSTPPAEFRLLVNRVSALLAYEATKDLPTEPVTIQTPLTTTTCRRMNQRVGLIPILRAGLGMVDPILTLIPNAEVWHLGLYRDEETALPVRYYNKIPASDPVDVALVVDPMLATGGSIVEALETLHAWGVPVVKVVSILAARPGVAAVHSRFPKTQIYACAIDPELNDRKFIVPGLGDAGDRTFNTLR
jgi:uracil phosphoribosyltransferase